jgi:Rad3-related DNA helicase
LNNYIHETLRPHQESTLNQIQQSSKKYTILSAPTGSGKSFHPAQLGHWRNRTLTLVREKQLQAQYQDSYQASILYGKANYECLDGAHDASMCDKRGCDCPYYIERDDFLYSDLGCLNYAKFLTDPNLIVSSGNQSFEPQYLFLDEAHTIPDTVIDWSGLTLGAYTDNWLKKPYISYREMGQELSRQIGLNWLSNLASEMRRHEIIIASLKSLLLKPHSKAPIQQIRAWKKFERTYRKIKNTLALIHQGEEYWYVNSDQYKFVAKPMTARFHFSRLFDKADRIVLMSATIGNPANFALELGLQDWESIEVPNTWKPEMRQVIDLKGPAMSFAKSTEKDKIRLAQIIANAIDNCPSDWTGIIHCPSKKKTFSLQDRMENMTNRPLWTPEKNGTSEKMLSSWYQFRDQNKGAIGISWGFWEGVDMGDDNICIVAYVPYPSLGDNFEKARMEFSHRIYSQRAAWKLEQGLGRTRRGNKKDYGSENGLVAIADGKWNRLKGFMSRDLREAII